MLYFTFLAGSAVAGPPKESPPVDQIALLQTVESTATRRKAWVNGFSSDWLLAVRADADGRAAGLQGRMLGYAVIHPYFLRPGANELRVEYTAADAGSRVGYRVASVDYAPGRDLGTVFADRELLRLDSTPVGAASATPRSLVGTFEWAGIPRWAWTTAPVIAVDGRSRQGLQAALRDFWDALNGLAGQEPDSARSARLAQDTRAAIGEFMRASELRGRPFTLLDELIAVASTLKLQGDESPESFLEALGRQQQARRGKPFHDDDEPSPHPAVDRLADGRLPPRLSLRRLDGFDGLHMDVFAGGRLARLTDRDGKPVIQFVSNYSDGPRGSPNPVRFVCDPWFRMTEDGRWELAAIYPTQAARQVLDNPWLQELLQQQPY